ncbi:unnamed protein product [Alopecurus aequalis]
MAPLPVVDIISDDDDDDLAASSPAAIPVNRSRATPSTAAAGASPESLDAFSPSPPAASPPDFLAAFSPSPPRPWRQRVSGAAGSSSAPPRKRSRGTPSTAATGASPDSLEAFSPSPPATSAPDFLAAFSPSPPRPRRQRVSVAPILLLDDDEDDPPPPKRRPSATPILVLDDTPLSPYVSEIPDNVAAETPGFTTPRPAGPSSTAPAFSAAGRVPTSSGASSCPIPLDSDDELDDFGSSERIAESISPCENSSLQEEEKHNMEENAQPIEQTKKKQERKRQSKEEKDKMVEEKKRQQEERKLQKEANKVQQAEQKKLDKQKADWDSGKLALESIVAKIDTAVLETGSIGGELLKRFSEKKLTYQLERNPVRGSILWKMVHKLDQHPDSVSEVPYILFVFQAEEFCNLLSSGAFWDHVLKVRNQYPTFTICYVTNKLMKYIKGSDQSQYQNSSSSKGLKRPQVEQVLCKLVTHYDRVHSKDCTDEAEVAEHIVGLTASLAKCQFRKPLTWLSVHANGVIIPNGFVDKGHLKKDSWFMSLLAIPKVQPRFALAIKKKYGTMRSLLNVYMDPSKTDREKELLLQDLKCEDSLGEESRKVGPVCSRRVYRILMAQDGAMEADEAAKS